MRVKIFIGILLVCLFSCKPKNKSPLEDLFRQKGDSIAARKEQVKTMSVKDMLINKWRIRDMVPGPQSESDRADMMSSIIEFDRNGNIYLTERGERKLTAVFTLSFDEKYILSKDINKEKFDTIEIQQATPNQMVLFSEKDNQKLVIETVR